MVAKYYNTSPACNLKAESIILLQLQIRMHVSSFTIPPPVLTATGG
jgi:hypothetical protein